LLQIVKGILTQRGCQTTPRNISLFAQRQDGRFRNNHFKGSVIGAGGVVRSG